MLSAAASLSAAAADSIRKLLNKKSSKVCKECVVKVIAALSAQRQSKTAPAFACWKKVESELLFKKREFAQLHTATRRLDWMRCTSHFLMNEWDFQFPFIVRSSSSEQWEAAQIFHVQFVAARPFFSECLCNWASLSKFWIELDAEEVVGEETEESVCFKNHRRRPLSRRKLWPISSKKRKKQKSKNVWVKLTRNFGNTLFVLWKVEIETERAIYF